MINHDWQSLKDMYSSNEYEDFIESKNGNNLFINDPERAKRIAVAAENGCDGSTHAEVIEDWQEFLDSMTTTDDEEIITDNRLCADITQAQSDKIQSEIDVCEKWHADNKSLFNQIG